MTQTASSESAAAPAANRPKSTRSGSPRSHHLGDFTTDPRVLLIAAMAVVVGTGAVGAAWVLLRLIALITNLCYHGRLTVETLPIDTAHLGPISIAIPVIGSLIIGFMARYGSEKIRGHGIPEALEAILIGQSRMQPNVAVLKPLSSAISIGTGGPFGAEGPIIMTGGAIGSLFAQLFPVSAAERKTLLVAGAAAGMTAVFGTPIAAILLAVELLLFEWKPRSFIPVAVAAVVAAVERNALLTPAPLFPFAAPLVVSWSACLGWILVGIVSGLGSGLLTTLVYAAEDAFQKLSIHWMWWPALGGVVVGVGGLIEPAALGVGYSDIRDLLQGAMGHPEVIRLLLVKAVIWSVALGSGTSGGVLAPLLIMGGALGSLLGTVLPHASPTFFAFLGMAAMMGGTMRAPLTASLFAVELTGNTDGLLPLIAACTVSAAITVLLLKRSILTEKIARRGLHITREYHVDPFDLTRVEEVMVSPADTLLASMKVDDAVAFFSGDAHRHKSYPVVDEAGQTLGMVSRADVLRWMREDRVTAPALKDAVAGQKVVTGYPDELVGRLVDRMVASDYGRVPVVDRTDGRLLGIVARKDLLRARAKMRTEESERTRFLGWGIAAID